MPKINIPGYATRTGLDTILDQFVFTDLTDQPVNTPDIESNEIQITGIDMGVTLPITVNAGEYKKNGGAWTSAPGTGVLDDLIGLRQDSSPDFSDSTNVVLTIGSKFDTWTITTVAIDNSPDAFTLFDQFNAPLSDWYEGTPITVSGMDVSASATASVDNNQLKKTGGSFNSTPVQVINDDVVTPRIFSSGANSTESAPQTLTIGDKFDSWTVTTEAEVGGQGLLTPTFYVDITRPNDLGDGLTVGTAKQTIAAGLALLTPDSGEVLQIEPGTYNDSGFVLPAGVVVQAVLGGVYVGDSGIAETIISLPNNGSTLNGIIAFKGTSAGAQAYHNIQIQGNNNIVKNCIVRSSDSGHWNSNPMNVGGDGNLIEDCAGMGNGRYVFQVFTGINNTFRRCIGRWDATQVGNPSQPNGVFTFYNSSGSIAENCFSIDYGEPETANNNGADYYWPWNYGVWPFLANDLKVLGSYTKGSTANRNNNTFMWADRTGVATSTGGVLENVYIEDNNLDFAAINNRIITIDDITRVNVNNVTADGVVNGMTISENAGAIIGATYVDGVKTADTGLFPLPNEEVIWNELKAVDDANMVDSASRGWTAGATYITLQSYFGF